MSIAQVKGENKAFMKCEVVVDASVEEVAAYHFLVMSRRNVKKEIKEGVLVQETLSNNNHSSDSHFVRSIGYGLRPRRWLNRHIWVKSDGNGSIIHAFDNIASSELLKMEGTDNINCVNVSSSGYFLHESVSKGSTFDKTKVTFINQISRLPTDNGTVGFLSTFISTRKFFNKDYEIDLVRREALLVKLQDVTDNKRGLEDEGKIEGAKNIFRGFKKAVGKRVTIETNNEFVTAVGRKVDGQFWCKLSTTVRCGGDEALAFLLDVKSRSLLTKRDVESEKTIFEVRSVQFRKEVKLQANYSLHFISSHFVTSHFFTGLRSLIDLLYTSLVALVWCRRRTTHG